MATIWRLPTITSATGRCRSAIYADIRDGRFPRSVKLGPRAAGWPADEVTAVMQARIAGRSDAEIQALVERLHRARGQAVPADVDAVEVSQ